MSNFLGYASTSAGGQTGPAQNRRQKRQMIRKSPHSVVPVIKPETFQVHSQFSSSAESTCVSSAYSGSSDIQLKQLVIYLRNEISPERTTRKLEQIRGKYEHV